LVELNLRAGLKAKAASAFCAALVYLLRGISLIPRALWPQRRGQVFRLHKEAAECAYFSGDPGLTLELARAALEHTGSLLEKVELHDLQLLSCLMSGSFLEGLRCGRQGLRLLGMELPERDLSQAVAAELDEVAVNTRGRSVDELLEAPAMTDSGQLACVRLLTNLGTPAYFVDPLLFALINLQALNLTLKHGNSPWAPTAYACHGMLLSNRGEFAAGSAFGRLAVELARRAGDSRQECRALISMGLHLNHWVAPLRTGLPLLSRAVALGIASGDLQFAGYALTTSVTTEFGMGAPLARVRASIQACEAFLRKSGAQAMNDVTRIYEQALRALQGRTRQSARFDGDALDEQVYLGSPAIMPMSRYLYAMLRLFVAYVLGDFGEALRMSDAAVPHASFVKGFFRTADHNFLTSLALAAQVSSTPEARATNLARIAANQQQLGTWAESCPENFRHK
ncbi:hypothetical protein ACLESO_57270, partial [Pyxidicoccus sp. 3LG]